VRFGGFPDLHEPRKVPIWLPGDLLADLPHAIGNVADDFYLWKINGIDRGREEIDVDHFHTARRHEERRLFDHVMSDIDDQVRAIKRPMHEVVCGKGCVA